MSVETHQSGPLLLVREAAERLAVSKNTVHRLVASGKLPVVRIGKSVRVSPAAIDAFIANGGTK